MAPMALAAEPYEDEDEGLEGFGREQYESVLPDVATDLCALRKEAVEARAASGIEDKWTYAEDAYNGEDEVTRGRARMYKPASPNSGFINPIPLSQWKRSTAFLNITRPYCDAVSARTGDMLFPLDDRNFEAKPTPKQDVEELLDMMVGMDDQQLAQAMQQVQMEVEKAVESVDKAQVQIDDWLTECAWNASGREAIDDSARLGTGVVKGPIPMMIEGRIQPGSKVIDVRNCYPDPNCGTNIHDGGYFFEKDTITARILRKKMRMASAGWLPDQIERCLEEGPKQYNGISILANGKPSHQYELWYFQGEIRVDALLECGCKVPSDADDMVWANVTLCNDYIVRISFAPLQDRFIYHMFRWQKRDKHWAGIGIAEQLETPQRGLNASIRNIFDNAALSALPQIIYWKGVIVPANGRYELEPGKEWYVADETIPIKSVRDAIMTIEIPTRQQELMAILDTMRGMAEETTGFPIIMQGRGSTGAVGTDQMQTNNASTVLRRLAKEFDDHITVPMISAYYAWLKEMGPLRELPEAIIQPRGSAVLVERDIQAQAVLQMVQLAKDPSYGLDPELAAQLWLKSNKFDPRDVALTPERKQELMQMMQQPDEKAQATVESAKLRAEALTKQSQTEAETDRVELMLTQEEAERKRQHDYNMANLKFRQSVIDYALKKDIELSVAMEQLDRAAKAEEKRQSAGARAGGGS